MLKLIEEQIQEWLVEIEKDLNRAMPASPNPLACSARYSLSPPAKRLRPLLVLATVASYEVDTLQALSVASAIECIHTYSLIHDDLPCMDDDDLRRGRPSLHKVVPEWQALLTGDYLLTYAFELIACAPHLSDRQKVTLVKTLSQRAGSKGMIGGQMIDLLSANQKIGWQQLEKMHLGKTASLIAACLESGGIIASAPAEEIHLLQQAGFKVGLSFQLIDDVLDYTGSEKEIGKPALSDLSKAKPTAVSLLGIDASKERALQLLDSAYAHLQELGRPVSILEYLFQKMVDRSK